MTDELLGVLREELATGELSAGELDQLIRQARPSRLLSTVAYLAQQQNSLNSMHPGAKTHLLSALTLSSANLRAIKWEMDRIQAALSGIDSPVILLKGAAYAALGLPNAHGRLFGDIDIMVRKASLPDVETRLNWHGWFSAHSHPHDQRYFREWMHEIPPLQHSKRHSVLDVHHTIVAPTSRVKINTSALFEQARPLSEGSTLFTLSPEDMLLHSAAHLFINGEFEHAIRDLYDMHTLLTYFGESVDFHNRLLMRGLEIGLINELKYAVNYCREIFNTRLPESFVSNLDTHGKPLTPWMNAIFRHALVPEHPACQTIWTPISRYLLYLRSHFLRMPLRLLVPHLVHKALRKEDGKEAL